MRALDRKLLRDLWQMRGQVARRSRWWSPPASPCWSCRSPPWKRCARRRSAYYERYRFADVFAAVERAPEHAAPSASRAIPGVQAVRDADRRVARSLDVAGLRRAGHRHGWCRCPERRRSRPESTWPCARALGPSAGHPDEVVVSTSPSPRRTACARATVCGADPERPLARARRRRRRAVAGVRLRARARRADARRPALRRVLDGARGAGGGLRPRRRLRRRRRSPCCAASIRRRRHRAARRAARAATAASAPYGAQGPALQLVPDERDRAAAHAVDRSCRRSFSPSPPSSPTWCWPA